MHMFVKKLMKKADAAERERAKRKAGVWRSGREMISLVARKSSPDAAARKRTMGREIKET